MLIILTSNIVICKHLSSQALHRYSKSRPTQEVKAPGRPVISLECMYTDLLTYY